MTATHRSGTIATMRAPAWSAIVAGVALAASLSATVLLSNSTAPLANSSAPPTAPPPTPPTEGPGSPSCGSCGPSPCWPAPAYAAIGRLVPVGVASADDSEWVSGQAVVNVRALVSRLLGSV